METCIECIMRFQYATRSEPNETVRQISQTAITDCIKFTLNNMQDLITSFNRERKDSPQGDVWSESDEISDSEDEHLSDLYYTTDSDDDIIF
ncbi:hypothetical protein HZS_7568 [Henneguya salminicola]|nr:hypothetical protein HZS_7568 [Henneguya salminicola]